MCKICVYVSKLLILKVNVVVFEREHVFEIKERYWDTGTDMYHEPNQANVCVPGPSLKGAKWFLKGVNLPSLRNCTLWKVLVTNCLTHLSRLNVNGSKVKLAHGAKKRESCGKAFGANPRIRWIRNPEIGILHFYFRYIKPAVNSLINSG